MGSFSLYLSLLVKNALMRAEIGPLSASRDVPKPMVHDRAWSSSFSLSAKYGATSSRRLLSRRDGAAAAANEVSRAAARSVTKERNIAT